MSQEEAIIYEVIKKVLRRINLYLKTTQDHDGKRKYASYLLAMITYLRQILIAPIIVLASVALDACKIKNTSELSTMIMKELKEEGLSEWLESPRSLSSTRLQSILDKIQECSETPKIIIFSAFRTSLRLLESLVQEKYPHQWETFVLEGNQSVTKKNCVLDAFKNCSKGILYLTYKTGSEGLNLQYCDTVFLMDIMWNSSIEEQAIARVARQGQLSPEVRVVTFMSNTGIEKSMLEKHLNKIEIAQELMNGNQKKKYHHMTIKDIVKMVLNDETAGLYQQIKNKK
jgi:SNF2 family DNA or RNA helicase